MTFALVALLACAAPAASPKPADPAVKAKELFTRAQKLYAQARYPDAIALFEEAYQLKPHPVIFFNIGKCWEQLGETAKALRAYRDYLRLMPEASDRETVGDAIANLERRLKDKGVQQLMVFADPPNAKIEVDGKALGSSPASIELTAGNHKLSVKADGYEPVERSFVMSTQRATEMTITLRTVAKEPPPEKPALAPAPAPAPAPAAVVVAEPAPEPRRGRVFTWVAAGLSIAAVASGATFGILTNSSLSTLKADYHPTAQADMLVSNARSMALGANISWGVAGAAAIVAVVLFILEGR